MVKPEDGKRGKTAYAVLPGLNLVLVHLIVPSWDTEGVFNEI